MHAARSFAPLTVPCTHRAITRAAWVVAGTPSGWVFRFCEIIVFLVHRLA